MMRLSQNETKALEALCQAQGDENYLGFKTIEQWSGLPRHLVRRTVRALARKGAAEYGRGLWTLDGEMAGSGYCATPAGRAALTEKDTDTNGR